MSTRDCSLMTAGECRMRTQWGVFDGRGWALPSRGRTTFADFGRAGRRDASGSCLTCRAVAPRTLLQWIELQLREGREEAGGPQRTCSQSQHSMRISLIATSRPSLRQHPSRDDEKGEIDNKIWQQPRT
jgi:hypothetical protein